MKRTIPFLAALCAATLALPARADEACAAAPTPDCLFVAAQEIAAGIEDPERRATVEAAVARIAADPVAIHGDLIGLYVDPSEWLDGRLGAPEGAADAARGLTILVDRAVALIGLGKHWSQPDLIVEGAAVVTGAPPDSFSHEVIHGVLFTGMAELVRLDQRSAAYAMAMTPADPTDRAALLTMLAALLTPR